MISNDLQHKIIALINQQSGISGWSIDHDCIDARECILHKVTHPNQSLIIVVKTYRNAKKYSAILEHDVLESFGRTMNQSSDGYFVPKVFGSIPEDSTFMMEWVESPSLERRLWRYCYSKSHVQSDMRRTFQWLNAFHKNGKLEKKPVEIRHYQETLLHFMNSHDGDSLSKQNEVFRQAKQCFDTLSTQYDQFISNHAIAHGDFTPTNVLIDDSKVTGIDLNGSLHLPIENDIALQFSYIAIEYLNMLTRYDFKLPPQEWPLLKVILDAYGYDYMSNCKQLSFFLFVFLYELLRRWVIINFRNQSKKTPLMDKWRLRNTEMIVKNLTNVLIDLH